MPIDRRTRAVRGAVAGALAATTWAALQPLDKRIARTSYDDVELLGRLVTRDGAWPVAGLALHALNGALFGAVYAQLAPLLPVPPQARGPLVALTENFALWPLGRLVDRLHPARDTLPRLTGNRRALAAATWRHLVFGIVLGELERRLNTAPDDAPLEPLRDVSVNGHGSIERAAADSA